MQLSSKIYSFQYIPLYHILVNRQKIILKNGKWKSSLLDYNSLQTLFLRAPLNEQIEIRPERACQEILYIRLVKTFDTWIFLLPILYKFRRSGKDFHSTRQFYVHTGPHDILARICNGTSGPGAPRKILRSGMARCSTGRTWPGLRLAVGWLRGRKVYD